MLTDILLAAATIALLIDAWVTRKWLQESRRYLIELQARYLKDLQAITGIASRR